jgi:rhodanese-related sulfurtransferase
MLIHKFAKPLYEAMLIIFLSAGVALIVNFIRTDTIPLTESYTHETDATLEHEISVEAAKKMIAEGTAVLVDARSSDDFIEKHISGALNLPDQEFDECIDNFLSTIHPETTIITYCDGAKCDLAKNLAKKLNMVGFNRAFYIKNGWSKWQENN